MLPSLCCDCVLTDEGLPLAGSPGIVGNEEVGLETEFAVERGLDFSNVGTVTGEEGTLQESLT